MKELCWLQLPKSVSTEAGLTEAALTESHKRKKGTESIQPAPFRFEPGAEGKLF